MSLDNRTQNPDLNQKESRSIDRAETENHGAERKESRHESRAEINSFEDEDPKPVPNQSTGSTKDQDQLWVVR